MNDEKYELIIDAKKGNKKAIEMLIKTEQANIYAMLYYLKVEIEDIDDLTQNILLKMSSKIKHLQNLNLFKTWLNQIILNTYYDYIRKNKTKKTEFNLDSISDENTFDIPDYSSNPQDSILNYELDLIIKASIGNLPMHYKIPITLREIQGLSYEEISNITNVSVGTVKSRIARARAKIKNDITKYSKE